MKTGTTNDPTPKQSSQQLLIAGYIAGCIAVLAALTGCAHTHQGDQAAACPACAEAAENALAAKPASVELDDQMMSRLEALQGEWEMQDENGNWNTSSVFSISSNGSVVREIMFPGSPSEMTNLYHMDGTDAVVTHYCAIGNQPRMVANGVTRTADGPAIEYAFDSVSNLRPDHTHVMGSLRLVFIDDNHIRQDWNSMNQNGGDDTQMSFDLRRKQ